MSSKLFFILEVIYLFNALALAQTNSIKGKVVDQNNAAILGANVTASNRNSEEIKTLLTSISLGQEFASAIQLPPNISLIVCNSNILL